jgi:pimeloyl-ACP methyl ester carboxylesterase
MAMVGRWGRRAAGAYLRAAWRALAAFSALVLAASGCAPINKRLDGLALDLKAGLICEGARSPRALDTLPFEQADELERLTRVVAPPEVSIRPLEKHRIDGDEGLVQEELTFQSRFQLQYAESDLARAYVYRRGELGERPVVLWSPGQSTSDTSFGALVPYLRRILSRDVDVVFFVPPYHLERTPAGYASGDAFLATDFPDHIQAFAQALSDMRGLVAWLRAQGVSQIGAMGSSMGSWILLRLATWDDSFAFLSVIVPVVRWELLMFQPEMAPIRERLLANGLSAEEAIRAYRALDPTPMRPKVPRGRISVYYGRYDRIAPAPAILQWAERWGIRRVRGFDRGHALMFFSPTLFREVEAGLDQDLGSIGWLRHGAAEGFEERRAPAHHPVGWPLAE